MATITNDIDVLLQASTPRLSRISSNYLTLSSTSNYFPINSKPDSITLSVTGYSSNIFTCSASTIAVGDRIYVSGTNSGTLVLPNYTATGTYYYVVSTNGTTQFTLSSSVGGTPITVTSGTISGLLFSIPKSIAFSARLNGTLKGTVTWSITPNTVLYKQDALDSNKIIIKLSDVLPSTTEIFSVKANVNYLGLDYSSEVEVSKLYDGITASIDKPSIILNSASDGSGIDYTNANATMRVYIGATEDTDNQLNPWTFNWTLPAGVTASSTNTKTLSITNITNTVNDVEISCTISKTGWPNIVRYLKLYRNRYSTSNAIINAYKRSTSTVSDNPGSFIYQFSNGTITPIISPKISTVSRNSNVATIVLSSAHGWAINSTRTATIICPSDISFNATNVTITATSTTAFTYTNTGSNIITPVSATGGVSTSASLSNSWVSSIAATTGTDALYIISVTALSIGMGDYDVVDSTDWTSPKLFSQSDISRTIYVYQRTNSSTNTSEPTTGANPDASYNFTNDTLTATFTDNTWSRTIPSSGGRYVWMSFATATGSPTSTDTIVDGEWSDPGLLSIDAINIVAELTNDYHAVPCNSLGTVLSYTGANTTLEVYKDGVKQTSGYSYYVSALTNVAYRDADDTSDRTSVTEATSGISSFPLSIVSLTADAGSITITAKETATSQTFSKIFTLVKNKNGAQGNDAVLIYTVASTNLVTKDSDSFSVAGTHTPANITFSVYKQVGNTTAALVTDQSLYYTQWDNSGSEAATATVLPVSGTVTTSNLANGTSAVYFRLYTTQNKALKLDEETIPVNLKGAPGADAVITDLTSEADLVFAANDGTGYTLPTGNQLKLYKGGVLVSSGVSYSGTVTQNGLTLTINSSTGVITLSGTTWTSNQESFTLTATYNSVAYTAIYTIAKSRTGAPGGPGTPARSITISGAGSIKYNSSTSSWSPTNLTLTAIPVNIAPTSYTWSSPNSSATFNANAVSTVMTPSGTPTTIQVKVVATDGTNSVETTVAISVANDGAAGQVGQHGKKSAMPAIYTWTSSSSAPTKPTSSVYYWNTVGANAAGTLTISGNVGSAGSKGYWYISSAAATSALSPTNGDYLWEVLAPTTVDAATWSGTYPNQTLTAVDSTTITWSNYTAIAVGYIGTNGSGSTGSGMYSIERSSGATITSPSNAEVNTATGRSSGPVHGDIATVFISGQSSTSYKYSESTPPGSGTWSTITTFLSGSLIVQNSIAANRLTIGDHAGNTSSNRVVLSNTGLDVYQGNTLRVRIGQL
jgi:hypothetical protein